MAAVVNLADELLAGVLHAAEHLKGRVMAVEAGALESLRWAGALPLLLRDLGVIKVIDADQLWACKTSDQLRALVSSSAVAGPAEERQEPVELVVVVTDFLWECEPRLIRMLQLGGGIQRLTVCSSLSERAHECYDFGPGRPTLQMRFDQFAAKLSVYFQLPQLSNSSSAVSKAPAAASLPGPAIAPAAEAEEDEDEEWGWTDDFSEQPPAAVAKGLTPSKPLIRPAPQVPATTASVQVIHLPLGFAPLLSSKQRTAEPSVFVLCHPICASAFPLLLDQVVNADRPKENIFLAGPQTSTATTEAAIRAYTHVKEVLPEHIPGSFRRSLKLLSHTLGEMLVHMRLDVKERLFVMGATSLKVGHTLLRILNELQEEMTLPALQGLQPASVILIDRTSDLAAPCSFGVSLLDRVLALLPQTPALNQSRTTTKRHSLHVTEIFPLHGCEPSPLSETPWPREDEDRSLYESSPFVSSIRWNGGAGLCHPTIPSGANVFRSLAFRPAKLALRDLDKRLQEVERELIVQHKISKTGSVRKPGEKKVSTRGRDVVLRRICNILEAGEPTNTEHSALIELGIVVLETLERMELVQERWDKCRERANRHIQLRKQQAGEWIIPELADTLQRHLSSAVGSSEEWASLPELLSLFVHAFALSAGSEIEEYTLHMIRNSLSESLLTTAVKDASTIKSLFPQLYDQLAPLLPQLVAQTSMQTESFGNDEDEDEWGWEDSGQSSEKQARPSAPAQRDQVYRVEAKAIVETYVDRLLPPLKECAQLFAKTHEEEFTSQEAPRSLIAQLCSSLVDPMQAPVPELERIVDASEQLTRAGIDLLKSGFSRFGFGAGSRSGGNQQLGNADVLVLFVVGGITFEEIQEVHDALPPDCRYQVILGGTTITNNEIIVEQLFGPHAAA